MVGACAGIARAEWSYTFLEHDHAHIPEDEEHEMSTVVLESTLTCPECGYVKTETMPTNACQWFYECEQCRAVLKPQPGDCCVYCSYGSVPCPPVQEHSRQKGCCS